MFADASSRHVLPCLLVICVVVKCFCQALNLASSGKCWCKIHRWNLASLHHRRFTCHQNAILIFRQLLTTGSSYACLFFVQIFPSYFFSKQSSIFSAGLHDDVTFDRCWFFYVSEDTTLLAEINHQLLI